MSTNFEFEIADYTVGMGWSTNLTDFRWILLESAGRLWSKTLGTLYFFPDGRAEQSKPVGHFSSATRFFAKFDLGDFDAVYAILRSEQPVFLRGGGDKNLIRYMEIHTNSTPAGEVDTTPGGIIVAGTGDVITDMESLASPQA